jgi:hypothetical protein
MCREGNGDRDVHDNNQHTDFGESATGPVDPVDDAQRQGIGHRSFRIAAPRQRFADRTRIDVGRHTAGSTIRTGSKGPPALSRVRAELARLAHVPKKWQYAGERRNPDAHLRIRMRRLRPLQRSSPHGGVRSGTTLPRLHPTRPQTADRTRARRRHARGQCRSNPGIRTRRWLRLLHAPAFVGRGGITYVFRFKNAPISPLVSSEPCAAATARIPSCTASEIDIRSQSRTNSF